MNSGTLWGTIFLIAGVSLFFGSSAPIFRILIGMTLVYLGFLHITGGSHRKVYRWHNSDFPKKNGRNRSF